MKARRDRLGMPTVVGIEVAQDYHDALLVRWPLLVEVSLISHDVLVGAVNVAD